MKDRIIVTKDVFFAYFKEIPSYCEPYGNGHINDTFLLIFEKENENENKKYILQRMNTVVFPTPVELMENIYGVTEHIRNKVKAEGVDNSRSTLTIIPTLDGENYFVDAVGNYWRLYDYVVGTVTCEKMESVEQFYLCGGAFGRFQQQLSDFPAEQLHEIIKKFHNTPDRYKKLLEAVSADRAGRLSSVIDEVEFAKSKLGIYGVLEDAHERGELPLRVTHNDTKINNILFDEVTGEPVCVIDLDTVMPGYSVVDFGDSIRSGANVANEDAYGDAAIDMELFEAYARGFIEGCNGSLTEKEIELLPYGALIVSMECGMRFLTDYLDGDVYFKTHRINQNLDRARCQFNLAKDMEKRFDEMKEIIHRLCK